MISSDLRNETNQKAMGGTELMLDRVVQWVGPNALDNIQLVASRFRGFDTSKKHHVFWEHDLAGDPESQKVFGNADILEIFDAIVFVSYWQRDQFVAAYPLLSRPDIQAKTLVVLNAIKPIDTAGRQYFRNGKINMIYTPTPHRGLDILVTVFDLLSKQFPNKLHLDVYSSFNLYGWGERDKQYEGLFKAIEDHPDMTNHGTVPNDEVRDALLKADVFAYPSTWQETSCLCLIEAMSAGCLHVCSDLAAIPETSGRLPVVYPYSQNSGEHAHRFHCVMEYVVQELLKSPGLDMTAHKMYCDAKYNEGDAQKNWTAILEKVNNGK